MNAGRFPETQRSPLVDWQVGDQLPLPRAGCAAGVCGGKLILAGGTYWQAERKVWSDRVDRFDLASNVWTEGPKLPVQCADSASVEYDGAMYIFGGGRDGSAGTSALSFRDGAWHSEPGMTLPAPRRSVFAAVLNARIYILGGFEAESIASATTSFWVGGPGHSWAACAPLPGPARFNAAIGAVCGRIIVAGGAAAKDGTACNLDDILSYDPNLNCWSRLGRLPVASRAAFGLADGSGLLIFGGYTDRFDNGILHVNALTGSVSAAGRLPYALADGRFCRIGTRIIGASGECRFRVRFPWTLECAAG